MILHWVSINFHSTSFNDDHPQIKSLHGRKILTHRNGGCGKEGSKLEYTNFKTFDVKNQCLLLLANTVFLIPHIHFVSIPK